MNQFRKLLCLLLTFALGISLLSVSASATTPNEAKVNDAEYATLAEAIANANAGDTVTLLKDVSSSAIITIDKALTLEGNGKKLTSSAGRAINVGKENCTVNGVTIQNLTINASGERAINIVQGATNITIDNVVATAANYAINVASSAPGTVVAITGSTLTGLNVVNVGAARAEITIMGGKVVCNDQSAGENYSALCLNQDAPGASIEANGVTVEIVGDSYKASNGAAGGSITIDGKTDEVTQMIAVYVTNGDYYYSFATLNGAVSYAVPGTTIRVVKPVELTEDLTIDKNITVLGCKNISIAENVKLAIGAGNYDVDITDYCVPGFKGIKNENGLYSLTQTASLPKVEVTDIKDSLTENDPDLTFALNFAIADMDKLTDAYLAELMAGYGHYYTDYVLTIEGLKDEDVTFNANGNADGYLAGQYDAWSENWVSVPFEDVTLANGESIYIMEYAAKLMGKQGLRFTLEEVAEIVVNFDCGVYFTPEFLEKNHDMKVTLELKVFTEDAEGKKTDDISVATNYFNAHSIQFVGATPATCTQTGTKAHYKCTKCPALFSDAAGQNVVTADSLAIAAAHRLEKVEEVAATCIQEGTKAHYKCTKCPKLFSDAAGKTIVTADSLVIAVGDHTLKKVDEVPATYTAPGTIAHYLCSVCEKTFSDAEGKTPITDLEIPQLIEVVGEKAEVSEGAVDKAIEEAEETGEVKLDLTKDEVIGEENEPVSSAELPVAALEKVAEADASLTLTKADAIITMDTKALEAVAEQAEGTTVILVVEEIEEEELTKVQQTAIKEKQVAAVISAELICKETNKPIGTEAAGGFNGGTVTVKIPFEPETGYEGSDYVVIYVADDGTTKEIKTDYKDGCLVVELEHFSDYVIVNTAAEEEVEPTEPTVPEETTKPTEPTVPEETTKPTEPTVPEETTKPTEPTAPEETQKPTEPTEPEETKKPTKPTNPAVPDTGDDGIALPLIMMLICAAAIVCLVGKKKTLF